MISKQEYVELIKQYENDYIDFMGINNFPEYKLELYEIKANEADIAGFGIVAQALYDPKTGQHTLRICTNLEVKEYIVFHEFTHILDSEMYANKDAIRYAYLSGYTEYHASQVELMFLLGAQKISDNICGKTMRSVIPTFPNERTVEEYIISKHKLVIDMMNRKDFPANIEALKVTLGVLYNYWGSRSICKLYLDDYQEHVDNSAIIRIIPPSVFLVMNIFMDGWFDDSKVEKSFGPYSNALMPIIVNKKLE